jgi:hypothetical protein
MLIVHTLSHTPADLAAAFTVHPDASQLGIGVGAAAAVMLAGGLVWLAQTTYQASPRLAVIGGVLGVLGLFSVIFDDAVRLSGALVVDGLGATQAADLLGRLSSGGVVVVGPLSLLNDIGMVLLAIAALRTGVPRWAVVVTCIGVLVESAGFAVGIRYLAAIGFVVVVAGFTTMVRTTLEGRPESAPEIATQPA